MACLHRPRQHMVANMGSELRPGQPNNMYFAFLLPKAKDERNGADPTDIDRTEGLYHLPEKGETKRKKWQRHADIQTRKTLSSVRDGKMDPFFLRFLLLFRVHFGTTDVSRKKSRLLRSSRQASTTVSGTQQATKLPASKEESLRGQQKRRRKRLDPNQLLSYARLS